MTTTGINEDRTKSTRINIYFPNRELLQRVNNQIKLTQEMSMITEERIVYSQTTLQRLNQYLENIQ